MPYCLVLRQVPSLRRKRLRASGLRSGKVFSKYIYFFSFFFRLVYGVFIIIIIFSSCLCSVFISSFFRCESYFFFFLSPLYISNDVYETMYL